MSYKIYSYFSEKNTDISSFKEFEIEKQSNDEFMISYGSQKFCVNLAEIFQFSNNKYFIFDDRKINFLISKEISKRLLIPLNITENIQFNLKFYLFILLALLILFNISTLNFLDG